jgi:hypothetical protein
MAHIYTGYKLEEGNKRPLPFGGMLVLYDGQWLVVEHHDDPNEEPQLLALPECADTIAGLYTYAMKNDSYFWLPGEPLTKWCGSTMPPLCHNTVDGLIKYIGSKPDNGIRLNPHTGLWYDWPTDGPGICRDYLPLPPDINISQVIAAEYLSHEHRTESTQIVNCNDLYCSCDGIKVARFAGFEQYQYCTGCRKEAR